MLDQRIAPPALRPDATLADWLRQLAFAQLPSRFYSVLELGAPLAVQAWMDGWYRTAGWLGAVSCFGLWAIAQQKLAGHADLLAPVLAPRSRTWRTIRGFAAGVGIAAGALLAAEAFTQLMAVVFKCPGCAG